MIRHREVDTSSPEGPGFNFLDADLNEALRKIQDRPAQFAKRHYATDGRVGLGHKQTLSPSLGDVRFAPESGQVGRHLPWLMDNYSFGRPAEIADEFELVKIELTLETA